MKYKNKDGIELSMTAKDPATALTREVIIEAIKILTSYNRFDARSAEWAMHRCKCFLEENFDINEEYDASCGVCNRKDNTCGCREDK